VNARFQHVHHVRFDEVDAAGIAYFAHFFTWCHDAMEALLAPLEGGYTALISKRRLGLPAVHVEADFASPLRFGDEVHILVAVERLGTSSCALCFELSRPDGSHVATVRHVVALTDLAVVRACALPADLRSLLESHRLADAADSTR
jgi:4-hydroxybenzoyl-CoA thioesterase